MKDAQFFICEICGNLVESIHNSGVEMICCGQPMTELVGNTVDAAREKHIPVIEVSGQTVKVKVGSVAHPMLPAHYIPWIYIQTTKGYHRMALQPGEAPETVFALAEGETVVAAYEYCNLHGLWKATV